MNPTTPESRKSSEKHSFTEKMIGDYFKIIVPEFCSITGVSDIVKYWDVKEKPSTTTPTSTETTETTTTKTVALKASLTKPVRVWIASYIETKIKQLLTSFFESVNEIEPIAVYIRFAKYVEEYGGFTKEQQECMTLISSNEKCPLYHATKTCYNKYWKELPEELKAKLTKIKTVTGINDNAVAKQMVHHLHAYVTMQLIQTLLTYFWLCVLTWTPWMQPPQWKADSTEDKEKLDSEFYENCLKLRLDISLDTLKHLMLKFKEWTVEYIVQCEEVAEKWKRDRELS